MNVCNYKLLLVVIKNNNNHENEINKNKLKHIKFKSIEEIKRKSSDNEH